MPWLSALSPLAVDIPSSKPRASFLSSPRQARHFYRRSRHEGALTFLWFEPLHLGCHGSNRRQVQPHPPPASAIAAFHCRLNLSCSHGSQTTSPASRQNCLRPRFFALSPAPAATKASPTFSPRRWPIKPVGRAPASAQRKTAAVPRRAVRVFAAAARASAANSDNAGPCAAFSLLDKARTPRQK